jgi:hypothetical protein
MKRVAIFCLLGPLLGWLALWLVFEPRFIFVGFFTLPWAYMFGLGPALVSAFVDYYLADKMDRLPRVGATAFAGAVTTGVWAIIAVIGYSYPNKWLAVLVGLGGAIAAAICSWLSGQKNGRA